MYFISIKNTKWKFCNMYQLSFENIRHFETKKPKPQTKKPFLFSSKGIPSTPHDRDIIVSKESTSKERLTF